MLDSTWKTSLMLNYVNEHLYLFLLFSLFYILFFPYSQLFIQIDKSLSIFTLCFIHICTFFIQFPYSAVEFSNSLCWTIYPKLLAIYISSENMRNYPAFSVLEPSFLAASMALFFFSSSIVCCKSLLSGYIMLSKKKKEL